MRRVEINEGSKQIGNGITVINKLNCECNFVCFTRDSCGCPSAIIELDDGTVDIVYIEFLKFLNPIGKHIDLGCL